MHRTPAVWTNNGRSVNPDILVRHSAIGRQLNRSAKAEVRTPGRPADVGDPMKRRFVVGHYARYGYIAGFDRFEDAEAYIDTVLSGGQDYFIDDLYGLRHRPASKRRKYRLPRW